MGGVYVFARSFATKQSVFNTAIAALPSVARKDTLRKRFLLILWDFLCVRIYFLGKLLMKHKHTRLRRYSFRDVVQIMSHLRGPRGCAWEQKQTHATLLPYLFEEAREVKRAIARKDMPNLQEELGDILLQVLFHSQLAAEKHLFTIDDVLSTLARKLIRRHPHVFGNATVRSTKDIIKNWRRIKKKEKNA